MGESGCGKTLFVSLINIFPDSKAERHFLLVGGFLGAGKTTLIGLLTQHLRRMLLRHRSFSIRETAPSRSDESDLDLVDGGN